MPVLDDLVDHAVARQLQHAPGGQRKLHLRAPRLLVAHQQRRVRGLQLPGSDTSARSPAYTWSSTCSTRPVASENCISASSASSWHTSSAASIAQLPGNGSLSTVYQTLHALLAILCSASQPFTS